MARLTKSQKEKQMVLEIYSDFLENHFGGLLDILNQSHQSKTGEVLPLPFQRFLRQVFEQKYIRLVLLLRGDTFTLEEAKVMLLLVSELSYMDKEQEKLEKILMVSRL